MITFRVTIVIILSVKFIDLYAKSAMLIQLKKCSGNNRLPVHSHCWIFTTKPTNTTSTLNLNDSLNLSPNVLWGVTWTWNKCNVKILILFFYLSIRWRQPYVSKHVIRDWQQLKELNLALLTFHNHTGDKTCTSQTIKWLQ